MQGDLILSWKIIGLFQCDTGVMIIKKTKWRIKIKTGKSSQNSQVFIDHCSISNEESSKYCVLDM